MRIDYKALQEAVEVHCRSLNQGAVTVTPRDCAVLAQAVVLTANGAALRVVEYAGGYGVTTSVLVEALRQVAHPEASLLIAEQAPTRCVILKRLIGDAGEVVEGDAHGHVDRLTSAPIDLLVIDSAHLPADTDWYIENLWPAVRLGGYIWLHDMPDDDADARNELGSVMEAIRVRGWKIIRRTGRKPGTEAVSLRSWAEIPNTQTGTHNGAMVVRRL